MRGDLGDDGRRLRQAAGTLIAARRVAVAGIEDPHPARSQNFEVPLGGRMEIHVGIHRGRHPERRNGGEGSRRHEVVGHSGGKSGQQVGGRGRDQEKVGLSSKVDVSHPGVRQGIAGRLVPLRDPDRVSGQGLKREGSHEANGVRHHQDANLGAHFDQQAGKFGSLVGGDPGPDPEKYASTVH